MQRARTETRPGTLGGRGEKRAGAKSKKSKQEKGLSGQSRRRSQKVSGDRIGKNLCFDFAAK